MRLFVAVGIDGAARRAIEAALAEVRGRAGLTRLTWARPEGWHVTLAFLGEVAQDDLDAVVTTVTGAVAGRERMVLRTGRMTAFGRVAVALEVRTDPDGVLASLGEAIQRDLVAAGLPVEERPVRPHLTVARMRRGDDPRTAARRIEVPEVAWEARHVDVVESLRGTGPAVYEVRSSVGLG